MSPLSAKDLQSAGRTPDLLLQWEALSPSRSGSPFFNGAPVDTFLAAQKAGITPQDVVPLIGAGLSLKDSKVVLDAVNLSRSGYSPSQTVDYTEKGITPDGVYAYKQQQALARTAARAAAARAAEASAILAQKCPGGVQSGEAMLQMSPFTIEGRYFSIGSLPISQWESATEALIVVMGIPIDLETDTPISGQVTPSGLYLGEAPLQYQAVSGAASTAYKLHYIGSDSR